MKIYKIECEWEMPIACGYFSTKDKAQKAIDDEDWLGMTDYTKEEAVDDGMVNIIEVEVD